MVRKDQRVKLCQEKEIYQKKKIIPDPIYKSVKRNTPYEHDYARWKKKNSRKDCL